MSIVEPKVTTVIRATRAPAVRGPISAPRAGKSATLTATYVGLIMIAALSILGCGIMVTATFAGQSHPVGDEVGTTGGMLICGAACAMIALAARGLSCLGDAASKGRV